MKMTDIARGTAIQWGSYVFEVAEELQTLVKPCGQVVGDLIGYIAKALYELRRAVGGLR